MKFHVFWNRHGEWCELDETVEEYLHTELADIPDLLHQIFTHTDFNHSSDNVIIQEVQ